MATFPTYREARLSFVLSFATIFAVSVIGCSMSETNETSRLQLANETEQPILYLAWERQASNTVDPNPRLPQEEYVDQIVGVGETVEVKQIIEWSKGEDVRFFLYAAPAESDTATYETSLDVSREELSNTGYRVTIDDL